MVFSIIFLPLIGFLFSCLIGQYFNYKITQIITTSFLVISTFFSWIIFFQFIGEKDIEIYQFFNWITSGTFIVNWSVRLDALTTTMFIVVT